MAVFLHVLTCLSVHLLHAEVPKCLVVLMLPLPCVATTVLEIPPDCVLTGVGMKKASYSPCSCDFFQLFVV